MANEFYEVIKITDLKEREIEAFYINPNLTEKEKLSFVLRKGVYSQKMAFISNIKFYLEDEDCVDALFEILEEKMLDFEQEFQLHIIKTFEKIFTEPYADEIKNLHEKHINCFMVLIVKLITEDEKSKVSY